MKVPVLRIGRRALLKTILGASLVYSMPGVALGLIEFKTTFVDAGLGKRVIFAPDAHIHGFYRELVDSINKLRPKLVLLGGDVYDRFSELDSVIETLSNITGEKVAVLGNHEHWAEVRYGKIPLSKGIKAMEEAGVTVLIDEEYVSQGVKILGIDWRDDPKEYANTPQEDATLVMVHSPDAFPHISSNYKYMLSGHTHGGQICLPGPRSVITNSIYGYRRGFYYSKNGNTMYVSMGAGHIIPVRTYCSRELVIIT